MATAKPKTKRMMLGGMAAGLASKALGTAKNAVAAKAAPMKTQSGMQAAARSAATQAAPVKSGLTAIGPRQNAASMAADARAARGATKQVPNYAQPYVNKMQGAAKAAPKQMQFMSDKLRGAPAKPKMQFMSDKLRGVGAATTGVARGMMKKGGAVKKATKK